MPTTDDSYLKSVLFRKGDDYFEVWRTDSNLKWLWVSGLTTVGTLRKLADLLEGDSERYVTKLDFCVEDDRITIGALLEAVES